MPSSRGCSGASTTESEGEGGPLAACPPDEGDGANEDVTSLDDSLFCGDQDAGSNSSAADILSVDAPDDSFADAPAAFDGVLSEWKGRGTRSPDTAALDTVDEEPRL